MRILVVQRAPNRGGSTMSALELAKGLLEQGNNVTVLFAATGSAVGEFVKAGCDAEILHHIMPYGKGARGCYKLLCAALELPNLVRTIQRLRPDCVYINSAASVFFAVASRIARVPCVLHLRESIEPHSEISTSSMFNHVLTTISKRVPCAVVANSEYTARSFFGTSRPKNLKIIYNGIDDLFLNFSPSQQSCRDALGLSREAAIVGIPGTLRPVKGQAEFLLESVANGGIDKSVIIAITGDCNSVYGEKVRGLGVKGPQGKVVFLGDLADMRPFYRACDIICVPSKEESFGRVVLESMAVGTPVVASGVGGIKEIIPSDRFGRVANGQDVARNCKDIMDLLADKKASQLMAAEAKHRVRAMFSERVRRLACANLLAELVNRPEHQA